jgi:hypothetical protein
MSPRPMRFTNRPPKGAQTLTRANGDRLIYDPASNVFAVATREGAPRTMFKPGEGPAYWDKVKAREAEGGARPRARGARGRATSPLIPANAGTRIKGRRLDGMHRVLFSGSGHSPGRAEG